MRNIIVTPGRTTLLVLSVCSSGPAPPVTAGGGARSTVFQTGRGVQSEQDVQVFCSLGHEPLKRGSVILPLLEPLGAEKVVSG